MANRQVAPSGPAKKVLCLDGGGVKGISSLMILQAIMTEVARIEDGNTRLVDQTKAGAVTTTTRRIAEERKPKDYFDLVGGTSTGGIIAVMLGRLDMNCKDAIDVYKTISDDIFAVRIGSWNISRTPILNHFGGIILGIKALFGSQFSAKYLNRNVDQIVHKYIPNDPKNPQGDQYLVNPRYDGADARGKMFLCATMADRGKALLFRNYTPPPDAIPETGQQDNHERPTPPAPPYSDPGAQPIDSTDPLKRALYSFQYNNVTIKEAVRATSAAPIYLPPEKIQSIIFWDGGLLNNNPVDQVWSARYDLAPNCHTEPYVSNIVSIGTTFSTETKKKPMGLISRFIGIITKSISFATNTEAKHKDFKRNIYRRNLRQDENQRTCYFRFNACVGDKSISLADFKEIPYLEAKTIDYLAQDDTRSMIRECAQLLAKRDIPSSH